MSKLLVAFNIVFTAKNNPLHCTVFLNFLNQLTTAAKKRNTLLQLDPLKLPIVDFSSLSTKTIRIGGAKNLVI